MIRWIDHWLTEVSLSSRLHANSVQVDKLFCKNGFGNT